MYLVTVLFEDLDIRISSIVPTRIYKRSLRI